MKSLINKFLQHRIDPTEDYKTIVNRVVSWILIVLLVVGLPIVIIAVIEAIHLGLTWDAFFYPVLFVPLVVVSFLRNRLSLKVKAATILVVIYIYAVHNTVAYGFTGAGISLFSSLFILTTIFFGFRNGLISIAASLFPMVLVGYLMVEGVISVEVNMMKSLRLPVSWITATAVLVLLGVLVVVTYSFIQRNLFDTLRVTRQQAMDLRKSNRRLIREIRQRDEIEKNLKKAKEQAQESDRLKSAFLANMSHEFRTPMNGIMGFARLLDNPDLDEEKRMQYAQFIRKSGDRMLEFMNSLLDIAMIESGQTQLHVSDSSVNTIIDDLLTLFKSEARNKDLQLTCHKDRPFREDRILTDSTKLKQILAKLMHNAIKYTDQGEVSVGYVVNEEEMQFFVSDTGIGISPNMYEKIFEPFRQAELNYTREYEGAGLGLSISRAYVEMMGGRIWLNSEPGSGSIFYFSIPVKPPENVRQQA